MAPQRQRLKTKLEGMMRRLLHVSLCLFTFVHVLSCNPTGGVQGVDAAPPINCTDDLHCPSNYFCRTASAYRVCAQCVDCSKQYRTQTQKCAKTSSDCGPCQDGFKDVGGSCQEIEDVSHSDEVSKKKIDVGPSNNNAVQQHVIINNNSNQSSTLTYVLIGVCCMVFIGCLVGVVLKRSDFIKGIGGRRSRQRNGRNHAGDRELLNDDGGRDNRLMGTASLSPFPTAPPLDVEEYLRPPSRNPTGFQFQQEHPRALEGYARAVPFNAGNGAGQWAHVPDETDGLPGEIMEMAEAGVELQGGQVAMENLALLNDPVPEGNDVGEEMEEEFGEEVDDQNGNENANMNQLGAGDIADILGDDGENDEDDLEEVDVAEPGAVGLYAPTPTPPPNRSRNFSSLSSPGMSDTCFDLSRYTNESGENSQVGSVSHLSTDSGTGTGGEEDNTRDASFYHAVPDVSSTVLPQNEDLPFLPDDVEFHEETDEDED